MILTLKVLMLNDQTIHLTKFHKNCSRGCWYIAMCKSGRCRLRKSHCYVSLNYRGRDNMSVMMTLDHSPELCNVIYHTNHNNSVSWYKRTSIVLLPQGEIAYTVYCLSFIKLIRTRNRWNRMMLPIRALSSDNRHCLIELPLTSGHTYKHNTDFIKRK